MIKIVKFDKSTTYMFPDGKMATPEAITAMFPATEYFTHVIEVIGNICGAVMELSALRAKYDIDNALTEDEAITEIERIMNTPAPEPEPSTDERIAAAMEFQNLLSL